MKFTFEVLIVLLLLSWRRLSEAFVLELLPLSSVHNQKHQQQEQTRGGKSSLLPVGRNSRSHHNTKNLKSLVVLRDKLWDRLEIEPDEEPYWYLLNCVATTELDLLRQCREICAADEELQEHVVKFVVPTEAKTRSHGANKMVTEHKVKYPGYVFAKLRLTPKVYEAIQELDLCRSWMGTVNRRGHRKLPPAPVALNELEVEKFGLEEYEEQEENEEEEMLGGRGGGVIVDIDDQDQMKSHVDEEALKAFQGLKVDDMIKVVVPGKFYNEDGIIRRLKDGKIMVRFYTYGTMFEYWMEPGHVRKLTELEVLRGLSGPTQPITQQDIDRPSRDRYRRPFPYDESGRPGDLRRNLMDPGFMQGARGPRNRRQDRAANRYRSDRAFGDRDEAYRNDRNWNWYQNQQRNRRQVSTASDKQFNYQIGSDQDVGGEFEWATGGVGSQLGRYKPQRQQRREQRRLDNRYDNRRSQAAIEGKDDWSSFVTPAAAPGGASADSDADNFFSSLMDDLSKDLDSDRKVTKNGPWSQEKKSTPTTRGDDVDDNESFFDALEAELADKQKQSSSSPNRRSSPKPQLRENEDFFVKLEAELGRALENDGDGSNDASDDFFSQLEAELAPRESEKTARKDTKLDDILSDILEDDESVAKDTTAQKKQTASKPAKRKSDAEPSQSAAPAAAPVLDLASLDSCTVPVLKEMLRERGLKVSGKKSELIERLQQGD